MSKVVDPVVSEDEVDSLISETIGSGTEGVEPNGEEGLLNENNETIEEDGQNSEKLNALVDDENKVVEQAKKVDLALQSKQYEATKQNDKDTLESITDGRTQIKYIERIEIPVGSKSKKAYQDLLVKEISNGKYKTFAEAKVAVGVTEETEVKPQQQDVQSAVREELAKVEQEKQKAERVGKEKPAFQAFYDSLTDKPDADTLKKVYKMATSIRDNLGSEYSTEDIYHQAYGILSGDNQVRKTSPSMVSAGGRSISVQTKSSTMGVPSEYSKEWRETGHLFAKDIHGKLLNDEEQKKLFIQTMDWRKKNTWASNSLPI